MIVTVIDRAAMNKAWGTGLFSFITRTVEIADTCPICGGKRGTPFKHTTYEDGETCVTDSWINPCGHIDKYSSVLLESET